MRRASLGFMLAFALGSLSGCASLGAGAAADALSGSGGALARDDDPELVAAAAPFGLKTMESILVVKPEHLGLLTALAGGFVQFAVAFVDMPADVVATSDFEQAQLMKLRARKLYLRARDYGFQGLDVEHEGFSARLKAGDAGVLADAEAEDVPLLYWTAAGWGLAIAASKTDAAMIADLPLVQAIAERCLVLDPAWNGGAVHELAMSLEMAKPGGSAEVAEKHFDAAIAMSHGQRAGTYVSFAEAVTVPKQDAARFKSLLAQALAIDVDAHLDDRLANTILQRRARWLLGRVDDLFLGEPESPEEGVEP